MGSLDTESDIHTSRRKHMAHPPRLTTYRLGGPKKMKKKKLKQKDISEKSLNCVHGAGAALFHSLKLGQPTPFSQLKEHGPGTRHTRAPAHRPPNCLRECQNATARQHYPATCTLHPANSNARQSCRACMPKVYYSPKRNAPACRRIHGEGGGRQR